MFIATPLDHTSKITKERPSAPVMGRLLTLAKASLNLLTNQIDSLQIGQESPDFKVSTIFNKNKNIVIYIIILIANISFSSH